MNNVIDIRTGKPLRELSIATPLTMRVAHLIMQEDICMCGWRDLIGKSLCQDCPFPETVQSDPDHTPDDAA